MIDFFYQIPLLGYEYITDTLSNCSDAYIETLVKLTKCLESWAAVLLQVDLEIHLPKNNICGPQQFLKWTINRQTQCRRQQTSGFQNKYHLLSMIINLLSALRPLIQPITVPAHWNQNLVLCGHGDQDTSLLSPCNPSFCLFNFYPIIYAFWKLLINLFLYST